MEADESAAPTGPSSRRAAVVVFAALILACATIIGPVRANEGGHYALVLALHAGTTELDRWHGMTIDISYRDGHYYAAKAPGLAFVSLPVYSVIHAISPTSNDRATVWVLNTAVKLPLALLLLVLVYRFGERIDRGTGLLAAFALGACTLVLPFTTLFFSHSAAAAAGFAAFALLYDEPEGPPRLWRIAGAGLVAGLGCLLEYPTALVAVALAAYAIRRPQRVRRLAAYAAGGIVGLAPLLAYNWLTFGGPLRLSYHYALGLEGISGPDAHSHGLFGITQPSLRVAAELLLQNRGLIVTTPIVAAGIAGAVLLTRRGMHAEGLLFLGLGTAFLVYNAGVTTTFGGPFGGSTPGPRYLVGALPFALAPIGLAYRRSRGSVIALLLVSLGTMALATATSPEIHDDEIFRWLKEASHGTFGDTLLSGLGGHSGVVSILPFAGLLALALAVTLATLPGGRPRRTDILEAGTALTLWVAVAWAVRALVEPTATLASAALAIALLATAVAAQVAVVSATHSGRVG